MSQPYVGEIRLFAGNFAPAGWEFCAGQILAISENETLFVLIGTTYGGDGQSTFALPDLRGRAPIHAGQGGGLSSYTLAQTGGVETVTLNANQIPSHNHTFQASTATGDKSDPANNSLAKPGTGNLYFDNTPSIAMNAGMIASAGGSQPHENMQPYLVISYIISLYGVYPSLT